MFYFFYKKKKKVFVINVQQLSPIFVMFRQFSSSGPRSGERSWARAEGTGKASKTKGPVHENTCEIVSKTQRSEADCVPWGGFAPHGRHSSSHLRFAHDLAGVFVHWALGLGGLAGALGTRPAALPQHSA